MEEKAKNSKISFYLRVAVQVIFVLAIMGSIAFLGIHHYFFEKSMRQLVENDIASLTQEVQDLKQNSQVKEASLFKRYCQFMLKMAEVRLHDFHDKKGTLDILNAVLADLEKDQADLALAESVKNDIYRIKALSQENILDSDKLEKELLAFDKFVLSANQQKTVLMAQKISLDQQLVGRAWYTKLAKTTLEKLKKLVVIKKNSPLPAPVLDNDDFVFLRHELQNITQQLLKAFVNEDQESFQKQIDKLETLLMTYFSDNASFQRMQDFIAKLRQIKVEKNVFVFDSLKVAMWEKS